MNSKNSILLKRASTNTSADIKDLEDNFSGVTLFEQVVPFQSVQTKPLSTTVWDGEHGEDAYFGSTAYLNTQDWEVGIGMKGATSAAVNTLIATLREWLTTDIGTDGITIYSEWLGEGRQRCALESIDDIEMGECESGMMATFKLKFKIYDPKTKVGYNSATGKFTYTA